MRERGSCPLRGNQCAKLQEKQMHAWDAWGGTVIRIATRPALVNRTQPPIPPAGIHRRQPDQPGLAVGRIRRP